MCADSHKGSHGSSQSMSLKRKTNKPYSGINPHKFLKKFMRKNFSFCNVLGNLHNALLNDIRPAPQLFVFAFFQSADNLSLSVTDERCQLKYFFGFLE